jgi:hypothetical protein
MFEAAGELDGHPSEAATHLETGPARGHGAEAPEEIFRLATGARVAPDPGLAFEARDLVPGLARRAQRESDSANRWKAV